MKKDQEEKIKSYIKDDRPKKLRSYLRKHQINVKDITLKKNRNLLHYSCRHMSCAVFRYVLTRDINAAQTDSEGNLPLHLSLINALKQSDTAQPQSAQTSYQEIILPLLEKYPEQLEMKNSKGKSCRELLNRLVAGFQTSARSEKHPWEEEEEEEDVDFHGNSGHMTDKQWSKKLSEEFQFETGGFGNSFEEDYTDLGSQRESYDDWADRIHRERKAKLRKEEMRQTSHERSSRPRKRKPDPPTTENLEDIRAKMRKKFDEKQKLERKNNTKEKKESYEKRYNKILQIDSTVQLKWKDIPWPSSKRSEEDVAVLFCDLERGTKEHRKYLREQQIRWHPDKFMQRFGSNLHADDKERILDRVTLLSQALNKLSQ